MKKIPRVFLLFFWGLAVFCWPAACSRDAKSTKSRYFGATYMTLNNPFFMVVNSGIEGVTKAAGDALAVEDGALDNAVQIRGVESLIARQVEAIFLNPVDWKGIKPALEAARMAKIPVFVVDAPVFDDQLVVATIASDNWDAGVQCARHLTGKLRITQGNIVLLTHPTAKSGADRIAGFKSGLAAFPGLKIIAEEPCEGQTEIAMPVMEKILKTHPEPIVAVMALNDPAAFGAIAALERAGRLSGTRVYGVDGTDQAKELIRAGKMTATAAQSPVEIGRIAAGEAYKYLAGEPVEHDIKVPVKLIDTDGLR